nr:hypothetical protein [Candidatus Sigynarchaeota archaeon]
QKVKPPSIVKKESGKDNDAITSALELYCAASQSCTIDELVDYLHKEGGIPGLTARDLKIDLLKRIKDGKLAARIDGGTILFQQPVRGSEPVIFDKSRPCVVCKSKVGKAHFTCDCSAEYHFRCARTLANKGEGCWQCGQAIIGVPPVDDDGTYIITADDIDDLSRQLDEALDVDTLLHKNLSSQKFKHLEDRTRSFSTQGAIGDMQDALREMQDKLFSRIGTLQDELSRQSKDGQETIVAEVQVMKDHVIIATELALFVDKPDEIRGLVQKVLKSSWPAAKKDAWAAAMQRVLEDWKAMKPTLWQKVGKMLAGVLGKAIGETASGLVSEGINTLWSWLSANL